MEQVHELREREKALFKEGNYIEAEDVKEQISLLLVQISEHQSQTVDSRHKYETEEIDNALRNEYDALNRKWQAAGDKFRAEKLVKIELIR
jgi:hypothetical protein